MNELNKTSEQTDILSRPSNVHKIVDLIITPKNGI